MFSRPLLCVASSSYNLRYQILQLPKNVASGRGQESGEGQGQESEQGRGQESGEGRGQESGEGRGR